MEDIIEERSTRMRLNFPTLRAADVNSSLIKIGTFALFISLSGNVMATTNFSPESCNTGFKGVVKEISDSRAPFSSLPQETILFEVTEKIKGNLNDDFSLTVLKGGPHHFKKGERFRVYAQEGLACSFELLDN